MTYYVHRSHLVDSTNSTSRSFAITQPTAGNLLVAFGTGQATFSTPAGWTLVESLIGSDAIYMWRKTADGTETSFDTTTNGPGYRLILTVYEFENGSSVLNSGQWTTGGLAGNWNAGNPDGLTLTNHPTYVIAGLAAQLNPGVSAVNPGVTDLTPDTSEFASGGSDITSQFMYLGPFSAAGNFWLAGQGSVTGGSGDVTALVLMAELDIVAPLDTTPPSVPAGLVASSIGSSGFTLTWNASTDDTAVSGYQYTLDGGTTTHAAVSPQAISGLNTDTNYSVQVRAGDASGNWSAWSNALAVTTTETDNGATGPVHAATFYAKNGGDWYAFDSREPYVFTPEQFGAKGDGTTDDTQAIQSAIDAALAAAPTHNGIGVVRFQAKTYNVAGPAPVDSGTYYNQAQLRIPPISASNQKVILRLEGVSNSASYLHWIQGTPALTGTVLRSTLTGVTIGGQGAPAVIAGPSSNWHDPAGGGWTNDYFFSNMTLAINGITIMTTPGTSGGPTIGGINAEWLAGIDWDNLCVVQDWYYGGSPAPYMPSNTSYGVITPAQYNNARQTIGKLVISGFHDGIWAGEHTTITDLGITWCVNGLVPYNDAQDHARVVTHYLSESVTNAISAAGANGTAPINIAGMDLEEVTVAVDDGGNKFKGVVYYGNTTGTSTINGGANLTVVNYNN